MPSSSSSFHPSFHLSAEDILQELQTHQQAVEQASEWLKDPVFREKRKNTAREVVFHQGKLKLYRYDTEKISVKKPKPERTPLLIVYALVNRPDILDFSPECSMIKSLLESGQEVYLIDWGYPDKDDKHLGLDNYIQGMIRACVSYIVESCKCSQVNLLGVCQGGVLALCYASLFPQDIKKVITMVTPVDTQTKDNILAKSITHVDIDLLIKSQGNISGTLLNGFFLNLRPNRLGWYKYFDHLKKITTASELQRFMLIEQWLHDTPDQAGRAFKEFVGQCYQENALMKSTFQVGKTTVDLNQLNKPVLNIYGEHDELVPPASARGLAKLVPEHFYSERPFASGHIGAYVNLATQQKVVSDITNWLALAET